MIVRELLTRLGFKVEDTNVRRYERSMDGIRRNAATLQANLGGLVGMLGSAFTVGGIIAWSDAWTEAKNKIAATTTATGVQLRSLEELNKIANESRAPISAVTDLYTKMARASLGLKASEEQVARVTETVSKALQVSGATAGEASGVILQLGQGLGQVALRGDELNSVLEGAPVLAQAIADEFGVATTQLKSLGEQGALSSDRVFKALLSASASVDAQFAATATTVSQATVVFKNRAMEWVGAQNDATGASKRLTDAIIFASKHIDAIAIAVGTLMVPALMSLVVWVGSTTAAFAGLAVAILANPITWIVAGLVALALAIQDVYTWVNGGKSIIGGWLGPWEDFLAGITAKLEAFKVAMANAIDSVLTYIYSAFKTAIENPWQTLWSITLPGMVSAAMPTLFADLKETFSSVMDWFSQKWNSFWEAASHPIRSLRDWWNSSSPAPTAAAPQPGQLPGRATGGPVSAGRAYMVGENGPEPFIPGRSGWVLPNGLMEALGGRGGSRTVANTVTIGDVHVTVEGTSGDNARSVGETVAREVREQLRRAVESTMASFPEVV